MNVHFNASLEAFKLIVNSAKLQIFACRRSDAPIDTIASFVVKETRRSKFVSETVILSKNMAGLTVRRANTVFGRGRNVARFKLHRTMDPVSNIEADRRPLLDPPHS
jgi:hypothetical protein